MQNHESGSAEKSGFTSDGRYYKHNPHRKRADLGHEVQQSKVQLDQEMGPGMQWHVTSNSLHIMRHYCCIFVWYQYNGACRPSWQLGNSQISMSWISLPVKQIGSAAGSNLWLLPIHAACSKSFQKWSLSATQKIRPEKETSSNALVIRNSHDIIQCWWLTSQEAISFDTRDVCLHVDTGTKAQSSWEEKTSMVVWGVSSHFPDQFDKDDMQDVIRHVELELKMLAGHWFGEPFLAAQLDYPSAIHIAKTMRRGWGVA